jgi:hypothetical protein
VVESVTFRDGSIPSNVERQMLAYLRTRYKNPLKVFDGYTECFEGLTVDTALSLLYATLKDIKGSHDNHRPVH